MTNSVWQGQTALKCLKTQLRVCQAHDGHAASLLESEATWVRHLLPIRSKGHLAHWQNTTKHKPLWFDCAQVTQQNSHEIIFSKRACDKNISVCVGSGSHILGTECQLAADYLLGLLETCGSFWDLCTGGGGLDRCTGAFGSLHGGGGVWIAARGRFGSLHGGVLDPCTGAFRMGF